MDSAPAIVFIDELDSIAGKRENAGKDMEVRIVAQLSSCLDDLEASDKSVVVIGECYLFLFKQRINQQLFIGNRKSGNIYRGRSFGQGNSFWVEH